MQIKYTYKVLSVDTEARTMLVKYTAPDYGEMIVSTRIPYVNESLELVIQQYSPVPYWLEKAAEVQTVDVNTAFGAIDFSNEPTLEERSAQMRAVRNQMLLLSDYTQLPDAPASINKEAWAIYRQELRDVTSQAGFPDNIVWPTPPQ
jgi:hypothetical protein